MILLTSWDDGHPLDERIGELLATYGLSGTFFVPINNCEGRPTLGTEALRRLDWAFEIGSHTRDHRYLSGLTVKECRYQVIGGKSELEQRVGHLVQGFCYPGGRVDASSRSVVASAGFKYARTTENLWIECGADRFALPTTAQFFPHRKSVLVRNFLRHGRYLARARTLRIAVGERDWMAFLQRVLETSADTDNVVHIWGHSWEIEQYGLWPQLKSLFALAARLRPETSTIGKQMLGVQR